MSKYKKRHVKRIMSFVITAIMFFTNILGYFENEVYAAAPVVESIWIETLSATDKTETKVTINGVGLVGASVRVNNTNLSSIQGVKITNNESGYYEAIFPANQGFNFINGENNLSVTVGTDAVSTKFNMTRPLLPTLSAVNKNIYVGKEVIINGNNLATLYDNSEYVKLFIGLRENTFTAPSSSQIKVASLDSQTGANYNVEFQVKHTTPASGIPAYYSYILKDAVYPLKIIEGLGNLRVTPRRGPIKGGTILNINATDIAGNIITDQDLFKDGMTVQLRGAQPSNRTKVINIPANQIEVVKQGTNGIALRAITPAVTATDTGKYDVVIKQGGISDAEAIASEGFEYLSTMPTLDLRTIRENKGKDTGGQAVILEGENIIDYDSLGLSIEPGGAVSLPTVTTSEDGKLKLVYTISGTVKYGDFTIPTGASITRTIEVKIGNVAIPIVGNITNTKPASIPELTTYEHYIEGQGSKSEGVFFKTPVVDAETVQKYDVEMETRTQITIAGGSGNINLPVIIERDKLPLGFEYERTRVNPKITSIEPDYGYYNNLDVQPSKPLKPIMIRIKGSNFQVERKLVDGVMKPVYPEVSLTKLDGQSIFGINADKLKVEVKKVLIGDRLVDGESDKYGDTMVVEISPVADAFNLNEASELWTNETLFKRFRARFFIKQTSGDNTTDTSTDGQPYFEFRYPLSAAVSNIQPIIENVYQDGFPVTSLSSDVENELEVKFKAANVTDLNSVKLTLDGIDLGKVGKISERKLDGDYIKIKFKTPRNIIGQTRLQVIVREGLMDSFDNLFFSPVSGPILKEIVPSKGQKGTWVVIKRDATKPQSARFKVPDKVNGTIDTSSGSIILFNGTYVSLIPLTDDTVNGNYEVKDIDTILFKIPTDATPGPKTIQIENPTGGRSQGVIFEVINPTTPTKIANIDPNRGDRKGGIIATITAGAGTSFAGEIDVYFGSQKATVLGYNIDYTEAYVRVPEFKEKQLVVGELYAVPLTVVNKERFSTDTLVDGYTYIYPDYVIEITNLFKEGMASESPDRNKGLAGDFVIIEGKEIRAVRVGTDITQKPLVYFGNKRVADSDIISWDITPGTPAYNAVDHPDGQVINLDRIKVKVPTKPQNAAADGSVTVMLINPDGATAIKDKGFIYTSGTPAIVKESSTLIASRFFDTINVFAKDVYEDNLIAAFGDKNHIYRKDLTTGLQEIVTTNQQEKLKFTFNPNDPDGKNIKVQYQYIDGSNLMNIDFDAGDIYDYKIGSSLADSKLNVLLGEDNEMLIGIKWNKEKYHQSVPITNTELLSKLNDEVISIKILRKEGSTMNELVVRRGLGKIVGYQLNPITKIANIRIATPYNDRPEKTKIYLINSDKSQAESDFEFTGGTEVPTITAVAGTKDRKITINNAQQTSKVFTQDVNLDSGVIKIEGQNLKNIQAVRIGGTLLTIDAVSPDGTWILAKVKKGTPELVGVPQVISVTTTSGTALSDAATDVAQKIYFMYISPGTSPKITTVAPDKGITTGGNILRITGEGFSNKDEFGVEPGSTTTYQITVNINGADAGIRALEKDAAGNILAMTVSAPKGDPGKATLTVINGDGGSATAPFNYISQPKITSANTSTGVPIMFNDEDSEITLIGEEFQTGAKIFIGATVADKKTDEAIKVAGIKGLTVSGTNKEVYVLGGYEATGVTFVNSKTIKFKMPSGIMDLDNKSIIIVNPDTGVSDGFEDGTIKPPVPDVPDIEAIPGFERTMILRWKVDKDVLNAAEKFEIYVRERRSGDYTFVGDTKQDTTDQSYVIKGLKYDTTYDILVRVLNKYGEAEDFGSVRETTLKQNQDYKEKEKVEAVDKAVTNIETQGKQEVIGDTLYYTVGTRESTINLSNTTAKNKTKYVQIPVRDIKAGNKTITITDKDLSLTVSYSSLNTPELRNAPDDAVFRFKISAAEKQVEESLTRAIPRVYKKASNVYGIYFELAQPKLVTPIAMLSGSATININAPAYPKYHAVYIESADTFSILQSNIITQGGNYVLLTNK
ncbi:IPT/TIG domain-containing protein [Acetoanaerobium noterae]|uniref:IPT/TIG domain-containing protein n=1 Tax=Acetoanaerobium noterae TaxID=745369 RepID=UPI003241F7F5